MKGTPSEDLIQVVLLNVGIDFAKAMAFIRYSQVANYVIVECCVKLNAVSSGDIV